MSGDAWGGAWGDAWGGAWGAVVAAAMPQPIGGGGPGAIRRRELDIEDDLDPLTQRLRDEDEMALLLVQAIYACGLFE